MEIVTDDERRRVARELRGLKRDGHNVTQLNHGPTWSVAWCVLGDELEDCVPQDWFERMCARLADLIDPCDMLYVTYSRSTCGPDGKAYMVKVRHRTKGWERDFHAVDREALLALADGLCDGYPYGLSHGGLEQLARRIREACGEASDGD